LTCRELGGYRRCHKRGLVLFLLFLGILHAVYEVTKSSLMYDHPSPNTWLGRVESPTVSLEVK